MSRRKEGKRRERGRRDRQNGGRNGQWRDLERKEDGGTGQRWRDCGGTKWIKEMEVREEEKRV